MHDTACCLGYPSDSMGAARERSPGGNLHRLLSPLWLSSPPLWLSSPPLWLSPPPLWLSSPPLWLNSLSSGRRRQSATSHGPWAVCLGRSLPRQIKPGPSVAAATIGVQREAGLGWQGLRVATGAPCSLSHLAGAGGQPTAIGHGRSVGAARGRARSNRASEPSPPSRARSGDAVPGWHGSRVDLPTRRVHGGPGPWHRPSLVRVQLGRRRCGGSPASRGLAGLGVTGLSAA